MKQALVFLLCFSSFAFGQGDTDSGNTSSQTGDLNTNQQGATVDSNNNTTTNTNQYNGAGSASEIPVASAVAPSLMSGGNDSCLKSTAGADVTFGTYASGTALKNISASADTAAVDIELFIAVGTS